MTKSRSEAKRLLAQGAIEIDGKKIAHPQVAIADGSVIRVGKRHFFRLVA
jgi:ribosomal protein S4